jgi:hypothetical protein
MLSIAFPVAGHHVWGMRYFNYFKGVALHIMDNYVDSHEVVTINQEVTIMLQQ